MKSSDPQFLYMVLVLPTLFGLTLIGEGLSKIIKEERQGWISIIFGFLFIGVIIFAFLFFTSGT